ncbi:signal peptide peptidase SppA, 36K type [Methylocaldum marinum]|uniref:Signal peptide peptidase SppA, 36K type n=1 Tax=Methylocaldum marinum TaxID=1432792 RepID=A0A250KUN0_9GAMM|nr:S49 family peptidase [Methylocaldum marinum]BBA34671.1 signal peptide peptidase SppA, 36K type [Methylocaldum marinum]
MDQQDTAEKEQQTEDQVLPQAWERDTLEKVLLTALTEQRRARRWGIFFKLLMLGYFGIALWLVAQQLSEQRAREERVHTAVIDVAGMIAAGERANADAIIEGLRAAADATGAKGIVLRMNTPGGSPVQSAYVYEEIRRIKKLKPDLPIYAVVADMCTSGGYYIASAADKIFVNQSSIVGSIGVIMDSFGFVEAINRLGIERRVMTAGEHKAILDPFSPVDPVAKEHLQSVLDAIHRQFIEAVRQGRAGRLKENTPQLYSGLVWTGDEGIKLGLADGFGDVRTVAESVIGAKDMVNYTAEENLWDRITSRIGTAVGHMLRSAVLVRPNLN